MVEGVEEEVEGWGREEEEEEEEEVVGWGSEEEEAAETRPWRDSSLEKRLPREALRAVEREWRAEDAWREATAREAASGSSEFVE